MKTKSLFIAALIMVSAVLSAAGKEDPRKAGMAVVPVKGSEVFKVIYQGETTGKVRLQIYDADAKRVLSETFTGLNGFILPVNFRGLDAGEYTIEVTDASGKRVEKITYTPFKNTQYVHVNKIANEEGKFLLSIVNTAPSTVSIRIYDANRNLLSSETKDISGNFAQVYKVSNASAAYTFEVSDNTGRIKTIDF